MPARPPPPPVARAAMIGHGGLCAKIIESGDIALGDALTVLPPLEG